MYHGGGGVSVLLYLILDPECGSDEKKEREKGVGDDDGE